MDNVRSIINNVYIQPIRSVLVVDDEFVSLDKMVDYCHQAATGTSIADSMASSYPALDLERAKRLISSFRHPERSWLCDIHDARDLEGEDTDEKIANHLHQSDLLILDYNLTHNSTDGTKALSFIKKVSKNSHFNLVVIYTNNNIAETFNEILYSLVKPLNSTLLGCLESISLTFSYWVALDDGLSMRLEGIFSDDNNRVELISFLAGFNNIEELNEPKKLKKSEKLACYSDLNDVYSSKPEEVQLTFGEFLLAAYFTFHEEVGPKLNADELLCNKAFYSSSVNWIKNERLFLTIVSKRSVEPENLTNSLLDALSAWNPQPHRLLMSKMRAELENKGVLFEDAVLGDNNTHAGWLKDLLEAEKDKSKWIVQQNVSQVINKLSASLMPGMEEFLVKLKSELNTHSTAEVIEHYHSLNLSHQETKRLICKHLNAYRCSEAVTGEQINTGHIVKVNKEYYVCLTPACDLQPGRIKGWRKELGSLLPVKLVRLFEFNKRYSKEDKFLKKLTSGDNVIFHTEEGIEQLTLVEQTGNNPMWEQMLLHNEGAISWQDNKPTVTLTRTFVRQDYKHTVSSATYEVPIVAQLRYEYALNLLQILGGSLSRVGLDFENLS
ncbi:response regulator receiver domain [Vibrio harveyi]|uniref:response regulator receiver domain n=1 Tax=Vibrio harveyi group TaxID=717610 RepID=UPI00249C31BE|nr:response regulator receiver domain [Vibrio campbellii]